MSETQNSNIAQRVTVLGGALLVAGLLATVPAMSQGMDALAPSFLYGASFWLCLTLGCFGLMLLFHVTRGRWGTPVLKVFEAGSNIPMLVFSLVLVLVAVIVFKEPLYGKWINAVGDKVIDAKRWYLNYDFFLARQFGYFVILAAIGTALASWAKKEEATGEKRFSDKRNNLAAPGIVVFILVMTFMTTDLFMSLDPHWFSTIWGFIFTIGSALSAMSLATMIVVSQKNKAPYAGKIDELMMRDFGNLLLMLTMVWAYFNFSQLLIIWSGNLPEFITFYLKRLRGNYSLLGFLLVVGQFLAPFLLLLSPKLKRTPALLVPAAFLIFAMRFIDLHWTIAPFFRESLAPSLGDIGMLTAIGGVWFLLFGFNLKQGSLVTTAHPYQLKEAAENV